VVSLVIRVSLDVDEEHGIPRVVVVVVMVGWGMG